MLNFVPENYDLRTALIFYYHLKKTAAESHRMLVEAYDEHALDKSQCFEWFKKFKSGDFDVRNEERRKPPKKFEDSELQALLDEDDGNLTTTHGSIKCDTRSHLHTFEIHRKDSEDGKMGST